jgi:YidC/Oxa1 family membrane protein insertase
MELYREYGINPLAGCFPALLQMPLFLTVYQFMLHYQFAFQKGTFLWINPSVAANTNGLTAPNLGEMDYPLIVLYGVTMLISVLMAPVSDPTQAKQQRLMSVGMSLLFAVFMFFWPLPSAFVLYWVFTNILSSLQSYRAYRLPLAPLQKVNAAGGGVYPKNPVAGKWMKMMEDFQAQAAQQQQADNNGKSGGGNGKPTNGKPGSGQVIANGEVKTGTPAKHKPKKRK